MALETALPSRDHGGQTIVAGASRAIWRRDRGDGPPFHALEAAIDRSGIVDPEDGPPLGAFGFIAYESTAAPTVPRLEPFPDAWFLLTDTVVHWAEPGATAVLWTADPALAAALEDVGAHHAAPAAPIAKRASDLAFDAYARAYASAREALERGDSYQLCLTYPMVRPFAGDPLDLYAILRRENPAPFAAYVEGPFGAIVSCSPERLVRVDASGHVEARPMKGTAPRPEDPRERARAIEALARSVKDRAENLMIADLLRNDLGRVCRIGSVRVTLPALVEEYATLLQMVSVVEGDLAPGRTRADLLASIFPPGSMTGAPKERAIEILGELEAGPRGPYAGALGYWTASGRLDLSVVIRSVLIANGTARVNTGGGIVWDSSAESEFAESRAKIEPLLRALASFEAAR